MITQNRQHQSRHRLIRNRKMTRIRAEGIPLVPAKAEKKVHSVCVVGQRRPIDTLPWPVRWLLRMVYFYYSWAASGKDEQGYFCVELQGGYTSKADAYNAARADGWFYLEIPLNVPLPAETCHFGCHDFPVSEASPLYRQRPVDTVILTDQMLKKLDEGIGRVHQSATANQ